MFIRKVSSSSMVVRFLICVDCTFTLASGGMMRVATVIFGSNGSSSMGRSSFHSGSIFMRFVSSSYLIMPWSERSCDSSVSFLVEISSWSVSSFIWCQVPSLMIVKSFSMLKSCQI